MNGCYCQSHQDRGQSRQILSELQGLRGLLGSKAMVVNHVGGA